MNENQTQDHREDMLEHALALLDKFYRANDIDALLSLAQSFRALATSANSRVASLGFKKTPEFGTKWTKSEYQKSEDSFKRAAQVLGVTIPLEEDDDAGEQLRTSE